MEPQFQEPLQALVDSSLGQLWTNLCGPAHAHPSTVAALDVDSEWLIKEWEREFFERLLLQAKGGTTRFLESEPGGGRTHLLRLLSQRAASCGLSTVWAPETIQPQLLSDPLVLYQAVASHLLCPGGGGRRGLEALLRAAGPEAAKRDLYPEFPQWGLALELFINQGQEQALRFLLGCRLQPEEARSLGLHAGLASVDGYRAIRSLLLFLQYTGHPGLVVLADGQGRLGYDRAPLEALRNLIDVCATGQLPAFMLVAGVSPEFRQELVPEYAALQQRLHGGCALGPALALRPILVLEELRDQRREQGIDFEGLLAQRLLEMGARVLPHLRASRGLASRNLALFMAARPQESLPPRILVQAVTRCLSQVEFCSPSLGSEQLEDWAQQQWAELEWL